MKHIYPTLTGIVLCTAIFLCSDILSNINIQHAFNKALEHIQHGQLETALALYDALLDQSPTCLEARYNKAHTLKDLARYQEAIGEYQKVLTLDPNYTFAHLGLAQCYLALGDFKRGLPGLIYRHPEIQNFTKHNFLVADLTGQRILIRCEWGFGDIFQFIRYAKLLKERGAYVILQSYQELIPLLKQCPYIDEIFTEGQEFPDYSIQVPLLSLPESFCTTRATIPHSVPYLYPDPKLSEYWKQQLDSEHRFKIGLCWSGRGEDTVPAHVQKNIPVEQISRIADLPGAVVYALQKTDLDLHNYNIKQFDNLDVQSGHFMDTAAIMQHLDLIITIDTSLAHLAGALNRPVWTLLPSTADWRWMTQCNTSAWYPSMTLFRQTSPGNWDTVIDTVIHQLEPLIEQHNTYLEVLKKNDPLSWFNTACIALKNGHLSYAERLLKKVSQALPTSLGTLHNLAYALRWQGKLDEAIAIYKQKLSLEDATDTHFGLAQAYLLAGNFEQGLAEFERGRADTIKMVNNKPNNLAEILGKKILILAEWGIGDMLQFIRYAKILKQEQTTVMVQAPKMLHPLLSLCSYIDHITDGSRELPVQPDVHIPLLSLPYICGTTCETIPADIPYVRADPQLVRDWEQKLQHDKNLRIGLCWHGSTHKAYPDKNIQLTLFKKFGELPGVSFYSLQKLKGSEELNKELSFVHDFGPDFDTKHGSFMDTAAVMLNLDLVITIDTSIAHLAGALGVPVWILLPYVPDWRWMLERDDSPWYPTMRLFRQKKPGDWPSAIMHVYDALQEIINN
jgi:ADP-heptose:LPS heptosyltransferase/Flp pilus assembly protein TadD